MPTSSKLGGKRAKPSGDNNPYSQSQSKTAKKTAVTSDYLPLDTYFLQALDEAGLKVNSAKARGPHRLTTNPAAFVKNLGRVFRVDALVSHKVNKFVEDATTFLDEVANLEKALAPCEKAENQGGGTTRPVEDSLLRLLLLQDDLQDDLMAWVLEKMAMVALEDESRGNNLPRMLLAQICWLDHVRKPGDLAKKVLEILDASPASFQEELIAALPQLVDEPFHAEMAMPLRDLMKSDNSLSAVILDTFPNLALPPDTSDEIRTSLVKTLASCKFEHLPITVKFVLLSIPKGEEANAVRDLRENLDVVPPPPLLRRTQTTQNQVFSQKTASKNAAEKDVDVLTVHVIRTALAGNKALGDAWFRSIEQQKTKDGQKTLDLLVLLLLHANPNRKKNVESLFKNKVRSGLFDEEYVKKVTKVHVNAIKNLFPNLMMVGESLCSTAEPALHASAVCLYR